MSEKPSLEALPELPERQTEAPVKLTRQEVLAQVDDIFTTIKEHGFREAYETYVSEEDNPKLQRLGKVLFNAEAFYTHELELADLKEQARSHRSDPRMRKAVIAGVRSALYQNRDLRTVIDENPATFAPEELSGWLAEMARQAKPAQDVAVRVTPEQWSSGLVRGLQGEVALARLLRKTEGVHAVFFSGINEDLYEKTDLVLIMQGGKRMPLGVKTGGQSSEDLYEMQDGVLEISLPHERLSGFRVNKLYEREIQQTVRFHGGVRDKDS